MYERAAETQTKIAGLLNALSEDKSGHDNGDEALILVLGEIVDCFGGEFELKRKRKLRAKKAATSKASKGNGKAEK